VIFSHILLKKKKKLKKRLKSKRSMIKTTTKKFTSQARTENILGGLLLLKIKNLHLGSDRLANIQ